MFSFGLDSYPTLLYGTQHILDIQSEIHSKLRPLLSQNFWQGSFVTISKLFGTIKAKYICAAPQLFGLVW